MVFADRFLSINLYTKFTKSSLPAVSNVRFGDINNSKYLSIFKYLFEVLGDKLLAYKYFSNKSFDLLTILTPCKEAPCLLRAISSHKFVGITFSLKSGVVKNLCNLLIYIVFCFAFPVNFT